MVKRQTFYYAFYCLIALIFSLSIINCDPIEAITDTYADIIDEVGPDDENKEENVGKVIIGLVTSGLGGNTAQTEVTVLNQLGNLINRVVKVDCTFTNIVTNGIVTETTGFTTDGLAECNAINGGSLGISVSQVAVSEGITSQTQFFFIGVT